MEVDELLDVDGEGDLVVDDPEEVAEPVVRGLLPLRYLVADELLDRVSAEEPDGAPGEGGVGLSLEGDCAFGGRPHDVAYRGGDYLYPGALGALLPLVLDELHELLAYRGGLGPIEVGLRIVHREHVRDLIDREYVVGPERLHVGYRDELPGGELLDDVWVVVALYNGGAEGHGRAAVCRLPGRRDDLSEPAPELAPEVVEDGGLWRHLTCLPSSWPRPASGSP